MKIRITQCMSHGQPKFVADIRHASGRRQRIFRTTRDEVELEVNALKANLVSAGTALVNMTRRQQLEVAAMLLEMEEMGTTMRECLNFWRDNRKSRANGTIVSLKRMMDETLATAKRKNDSERYVESLEWTLGHFIKGREMQAIAMIGRAEIEDWLAAQKSRDGTSKAAPATVAGLRGRLGSMFQEAVRCEYISEIENPMRLVISPKIPTRKQPFYTPKQVEDLLWVCRQTAPEWLPWLCLGLFAGVRPEELEQLRWSDIDLKRGEILIDDPQGGAGRYRRVFKMEQVLIDWLNHCQEINPKHVWIVPVEGDRADAREMKRIRQAIKRFRNRLCFRSGIPWHQDILRKSACTYLMLLKGDENIVAAILGNSPKIIYKNYRGLGRHEDSVLFWALTPAQVKNLPIELPKGGNGVKKTGKLIP